MTTRRCQRPLQDFRIRRPRHFSDRPSLHRRDRRRGGEAGAELGCNTGRCPASEGGCSHPQFGDRSVGAPRRLSRSMQLKCLSSPPTKPLHGGGALSLTRPRWNVPCLSVCLPNPPCLMGMRQKDVGKMELTPAQLPARAWRGARGQLSGLRPGGAALVHLLPPIFAFVLELREEVPFTRCPMPAPPSESHHCG